MTPAGPGDPDPVLSAEVLLAPEYPPDPGTPVTAATIARFQPAPDAAERVRGAFRQLGFDVGPVTGASFSITAGRSRFEGAFGTTVTIDDDGRVHVGDAGSEGDDLELGTDPLPGEVRGLVRTIAFSPPPSYGLDR